MPDHEKTVPDHEKTVTDEKRDLPQTEDEWRERLTPEQYDILRQKGTERAFTGAYWDEKRVGEYRCAGCGEVLYTSDTKYDSGCGWPSFFAAAGEKALREEHDDTHGMRRTELLCNKCGGHLGHVFPDGPQPTGMRHCINSASLQFVPEDGSDEEG